MLFCRPYRKRECIRLAGIRFASSLLSSLFSPDLSSPVQSSPLFSQVSSISPSLPSQTVPYTRECAERTVHALDSTVLAELHRMFLRLRIGPSFLFLVNASYVRMILILVLLTVCIQLYSITVRFLYCTILILYCRYNFDAVSCESCKAFFRRNAFNVCASLRPASFSLLISVNSTSRRL